MSIVTECMIANLSIGMWAGQKLDKEAGRRITDEAGASQDAGNFNKHIVPKEVLKPITAAANALRAHFYQYTLPWKDNGDRLLTRKAYMQFVETYEELHRAFLDAVEQFVAVDYPTAYAKAEFRMGDLFDPNDYPSANSLRRRFYVQLDIDGVTTANDFRVEMDETERAKITARIEEALGQRIAGAMSDVWARLADTLRHLQSKLGTKADGKPEVFRDSTVTNLEEIVALLPALNVTNDPALERVRADIEATIIGYSPKQLRNDETVRTSVNEDAARILEDMAGLMNAFGKGDEA